jgi:hypothetical protein
MMESVSSDDLTNEILELFESDLRETDDISVRTEEELSNSKHRTSFGNDERLFKRISGIEDE